jgi:hypothetical protein
MENINDVYVCNPCHVEMGGKHGKVGGNFALKQMIAYEWCMKVGAMLKPPCIE